MCISLTEILTNRWTLSPEGIAVPAAPLQEVIEAGARDPHERARAVQRAHVHVQRPHVVTNDIAVHWKEDKN